MKKMKYFLIWICNNIADYFKRVGTMLVFCHHEIQAEFRRAPMRTYRYMFLVLLIISPILLPFCFALSLGVQAHMLGIFAAGLLTLFIYGTISFIVGLFGKFSDEQADLLKKLEE